MPWLSSASIVASFDAIADWCEHNDLGYSAVRCPIDGWGVEVRKGDRSRFIVPLEKRRAETVEDYKHRMAQIALYEFSAPRQVMQRVRRRSVHA